MRRLVLRRSAIHGNGVFAGRRLKRGERLIEYRGKRLTNAQADATTEYDAEGGHTFLFTLNDDYTIDGGRQGNIARWINHSCAPNCEAVLEEDPGGNRRRDRLFIEARRDIAPGEELTYDYGIVLDEPHTPRMKRIWACRCGARRCTGTLLKPKRGRKA